VDQGAVTLCLSPAVIGEIEQVLNRPELIMRFPKLNSQVSQNLLRAAREKCELIAPAPASFTLWRDPEDQMYIDLAIATGASFLVSWNQRHLNYLMKRDTPEGREFVQRYPELRICTPPEFLEIVAPR
jgi:putative PIN family toxin of toxin-antitoxin system